MTSIAGRLGVTDAHHRHPCGLTAAVGLAIPVRPDGAAEYRRDAAELHKALCSLDEGMGVVRRSHDAVPADADSTTTWPSSGACTGRSPGASRASSSATCMTRGSARSSRSHPPCIALLERADGLPYRPGALRPDFLVDTAGAFRVCEVNARFPTNGFMCSYFTNEAVDGLGYLAGAPARSMPGLHRTLDALCSRFRTGEPLRRAARPGGRHGDLPPGGRAAPARHRRPLPSSRRALRQRRRGDRRRPTRATSSSSSSSATSCSTCRSNCSTPWPPARARSTTSAR